MTGEERLAHVRAEVGAALRDLSRLFNRGCRLTFVMRSPRLTDGDLVITDDDLREVEGAVRRLRMRDEPAGDDVLAQLAARPREDWGEDDGPVLWWTWPVREPPYAGTPLDDDFPDYVTHWTPIVVPAAAVDAREESDRG